MLRSQTLDPASKAVQGQAVQLFAASSVAKKERVLTLILGCHHCKTFFCNWVTDASTKKLDFIFGGKDRDQLYESPYSAPL